MKMRPPKNLREYTSAQDAALWLRRVAADIEKGHATERVMIDVNIRFWNDEWLTPYAADGKVSGMKHGLRQFPDAPKMPACAPLEGLSCEKCGKPPFNKFATVPSSLAGQMQDMFCHCPVTFTNATPEGR